MKDELLTSLERHSQIREAEYFLAGTQHGHARIDVTWANGARKTFTIMEAVRWITAHDPRCWSWVARPARHHNETGRDYCLLRLDHSGLHVGDRGEWE